MCDLQLIQNVINYSGQLGSSISGACALCTETESSAGRIQASGCLLSWERACQQVKTDHKNIH